MPIEKRTDDGYRGLLRNPKTGRVFKANRVTAKRNDLERVRMADEEGEAVTGKDNVVDNKKAVGKTPEPTSSIDSSEADEALKELLDQAEGTDDKELLKSIGAQIGIKLTAAMSEKTMRQRIKKQVDAISATGD